MISQSEVEGYIGSRVRISNLTFSKQVRFPKSKKRRIQKKWARNPKYHQEFIDSSIYRVGGVFIMHPQTYALLQDKIEKEQIAYHEKWG